MSEKTLAALEKAISDHYTDETEGGWTVDYVLAVSGSSMGDGPVTHHYMTWNNTNAAPHSLLGLAEVLSNNLRMPSFDNED